MPSRLLALALLLSTVGCEAEGSVITPDDLSGIFVRRSACNGTTLNATIGSIVGSSDGSAAASSSVLSCERSADSCEALWRCGGIDPEASCDPTTFESRCEGTERITCSRGRERRTDCASDDDGNTTCGMSESGITSCGTGPCAGSGLRCEGEVIVGCRDGFEGRSEDCSLAGRACVVDTGMRAGCVDRVEACTMDRCEGATALSCVAGMGFVETDCAATPVAGNCRVQDGVASCFAEASECTDGAGECAGAIARLCVAGRWVELDCAAFQGGVCVDESADGVAALRCEIG